MTENQRLKLIMDELHFKTQNDFAYALNIKPGSLSDVLRRKGNMNVSNSIKDRLEFVFSVNREWLTTGQGEMFIKKQPKIEEIKEGVPFYDIGIADVDGDQLQVGELAVEYFVNYKPFNDCTAYLPVFGDSMYPRYAAGDIIAVKQIKNFDALQWGEAYVVFTNSSTNNIRSIKTVHEHSNSGKIILRSSNPNFRGDTIVDKANIQSMYIIKGKITRNLI